MILNFLKVTGLVTLLSVVVVLLGFCRGIFAVGAYIQTRKHSLVN